MWNACLVTLQIRDVPDDIRQALTDQAAARGQSVQAFLLTLVTDEAHRSSNLNVLERFAGRQDGSQLPSAQVTEALDRARAGREGLLSDAESDGQ